ncbi:hypothetical protein K4L06_09550 [Lysobacter sp. BMK333-48F3]|uniref:hypothetical protein n=1 Tax=Lysobacter sp. BMK333-48F3 TaxID=2867962 RepID=UPI001C8BFA58|nr:hypothetical protein [Lysobacter sp. BMK333-48F3]MBX9401558.1 hypothetical protein [Lysobacter sp. BMK333-48F3]
MNAPMIIVLVVAAVALIVCFIANNIRIVAAGLVTVWLSICYMLLIPFVSAFRLAVMPADSSSQEYMAVGRALSILLDEVASARWAIAVLSFALVVVALFKSRRGSRDER